MDDEHVPHPMLARINGCAWNSSNESRPMRRPWRKRFGTRHDGSTQAPSDSYRGPGVRLVQQTHPSYSACKHSVAGAVDAITSGILPGKWYTSRLCMIRMIAKLDLA